MPVRDQRLRKAARQGDTRACLAVAESLFNERAADAKNYALGVAYLQQELDRENAAAILLVANLVPLNAIVLLQLRPHLQRAAESGSCIAMLKWGVLLALRAETRTEGLRYIERSRISIARDAGSRLEKAVEVADLLRCLPQRLVDAVGLAVLEARTALEEQSLDRACFFILVAAAIAPSSPTLAAVVWQAVHLASAGHTNLDLPVELVESSLETCSANGEVEAQYGLGCALAGIPYGQCSPQRIVRSRNFETAASLLLRAADAGNRQAWLNLSEILPNCRSALSGGGVARFFLEKAAHANVLEAQTKLGAALLREATSLENAEAGIKWLVTAAERSCPIAQELLRTLVLPLPDLPLEAELAIVRQVESVDAELGTRIALARALHLTRREAMNFNAKRDIKSWGLLIPGASYENPKGRLAPAVSQRAKDQLRKTAEFFDTCGPVDRTLLVQRSRAQARVFKQFAISEASFFANEIGRSRSHYGWGRHWAGRSALLLHNLLGETPRPVTTA